MRKSLIHAWLIMRIATFLILAGCLHLSAASYSQTVSLDVKHRAITEVLHSIEQQTGYLSLGSSELFKHVQPITVHLNNVPLEKALQSIFSDQPITYRIQGKTIILYKKQVTSEIQSSDPGNIGSEKVIQQNYFVIGSITDSTRKAIPKATIRVLRTNRTVLADEAGRFVLGLPDMLEDDVIRISSVGFKSLDVPIAKVFAGNGPEIKNLATLKRIGSDSIQLFITLPIDLNALQDVEVSPVNTGYQRIRPEQSTGAVSVITSREYESRISTDFLSGLVNKLPGLVINNDVQFTSSLPGNNGSIPDPTSRSLFNVRGISTMTGNQSPLIVIDGYPTELSLNLIDPNEIKSVTVLKDAAASTVYGVRASNGIIVIERKQAQEGKPQVTFRATAGFTQKENYSRYRWAPDASGIGVSYLRDIYQSSVNADTWGQLATRNASSAYPSPYYVVAQQAADIITPDQAERSFTGFAAYNNAKEYSDLFLRTAATQTYNLNVSGGGPTARYYVTANYTNNLLQQVNNRNDRLLLSARSTFNFSRRFSAELTTDLQEGHANGAPVPAITSLYPFEHLQDAVGNPLAVNAQSGINPYYNQVLLNQGLEDNLYYPLVDVQEISDRTHDLNNRVTANFDYQIADGLNITFGGIYEISRTDSRHYASERSSEARQYINSYATAADDGSVVFNVPRGGFLQQPASDTRSYTARAQLNYNKKIGKDHSINGIIGAEIRDLRTEGNSAAYFGYNDETLLQQPINYADIANSSIIGSFVNALNINYATLFNQLYTDDRYVSGYSNIVYAFRDTYSLSGSIRIDQSNLFGTDPRYRYKPLWSVGAAWNIHKENFMQPVDWINQLKLRIAEGFNGNVAKLSLPQAIAQSYVNSYTNPFSDALRLLANANSSLRWEQTNNFNIGLDYGIFRGISGSIDYYTKKSTDLLASAYIDPTIGRSPSYINNASINNKGLEFSLHADWISRQNFNWNTGIVLARNTSKVLKVYQNLTYQPPTLNQGGYLEGYPVGALFAYRWGGLDASGTPLVKDEAGNVFPATSNEHLLGEDAGTIRFMGSSVPTINAGMSNRVDIGNFYFYCMVNYYGGFKVNVPRADPSVERPLAGSGNYWKQPGDEQRTDVMALAGFSDYYSRMVYNAADTYVADGDYLTLGDLTASYSFNDSALLKKIGFSHFEVKLQASNVWTLGLNRYNYSAATGSYAKPYLTPTYTIGIFTNF